MNAPGWRNVAADLPIGETIDPLLAALAEGTTAVLHAPPGAGKTTIVPLALADQAWCTGTVVMLEPRRLAVRAAAGRLASILSERPGESIGWRMRHDTKVSSRTRIEVVTEGTLTRRLQRDPELTGVSAIVFDEFHERSLDADVGMAFTLEAAEAFRPDLRVIAMSATLDVGPLAELLRAPVVASQGRAYPIEIVHIDTERFQAGRRARMEPAVADAVRRALNEVEGDVLAFLPGAGEIERCRSALSGLATDHLGIAIDVHALYGALSGDRQDLAIAPSPPGRRKVVLATSIAETSLTIEGVTAVVDAGWRRTARLDSGTGMSRLVTLPVTRAEATQRAGRAGRVKPGVAYRLWSKADDATLRSHPEPEITVTDLTGLALDLAAWGSTAESLAWLTPPPSAHLAAARSLLVDLGALTATGTATAHGRRMAEIPTHPRLAHLLLRAAELGLGPTGARVAAVLGESGLRSRNTDLAARLAALDTPSGRDRATTNRAAASRAKADAKRFAKLADQARVDPARVQPAQRLDPDSVGLVAALGYPDRVGRRRGGQRGEFILASGTGAFCDEADPLASTEFVCAIETDGERRRARIRLGVPLSEDDVRAVAGDRLVDETVVGWDRASGDVQAERRQRFGAVALVTTPVAADDVNADDFTQALLEGIAAEGAGILPWNSESRSLQARLNFVHTTDSSVVPSAVDDDTLAAEAQTRFAPYLAGMRRRRDLKRVDMTEVLLHGLDWRQRSAVDRLAPERIAVPSGNRHRVDYDVNPPVLAVKLQEMFGTTQTPTVADGRVRVTLHLLSPAGRPLQVTQDLTSFWAGAYAEVRSDMRGRYPKHPWPEDPGSAIPTARTKGRS